MDTTSAEESFSHTYNAEGNFNVTLIVTDDQGLGATASQKPCKLPYCHRTCRKAGRHAHLRPHHRRSRQALALTPANLAPAAIIPSSASIGILAMAQPEMAKMSVTFSIHPATSRSR